MAVILGLIGLIAIVIFSGNPHLSGVNTVIVLILDIAALVLAFFAGRAAKRAGGKALWRGAFVGLIFGVVSAAGAFFVHISNAQIQQQIQKTHSSAPLSVAQLSAIVNSPAVHALGIVENGILFGVLGLLVGLIGGASTKRDGEQEAV